MDRKGWPRRLVKTGIPTIVVALAFSSCGSGHASVGSEALPQTSAATRAAAWLARQVDAAGFIPTTSDTGPDLSATAQTVLGLSAARYARSVASAELTYLEQHAEEYIALDGAAGPGQLGILILDAEALGADPRDFGGSDLVEDLLATEQRVGPDTGLFGTEAQLVDEVAGTYDQGIALAALATADVRRTPAVQAAARWLVDQQCHGGGWTLPDIADNSCSAKAPDGGPDTNSTAMAVQGLAAQGDLSATVRGKALVFVEGAQQPDGGWSYEPPARDAPTPTDPDSTALVIQALISAGLPPTSSLVIRGTTNPVRALLRFRVRSGTGDGAFFYPPGPAQANIIATYQAIPALMGLTIAQIPATGFHTPGGAR